MLCFTERGVDNYQHASYYKASSWIYSDDKGVKVTKDYLDRLKELNLWTLEERRNNSDLVEL